MFPMPPRRGSLSTARNGCATGAVLRRGFAAAPNWAVGTDDNGADLRYKDAGRPHIPLRRLLMFPAQSCRIAAHSCARVRQVGPHNVGRTFKAERPRVRMQRRVAVAKPRGAPFANRVMVIGDSDGPRHRAPSVVAADCGFLLKANPRSPGDAVLAVRDGAVAGRSLVFERVACRGVAGGFGFAPGLNLVPGTLAQARNRPRLR